MPKSSGSVDLYLRMSQDRTGQGAGHDRQLRDCRKLAKQLGLPVRNVFTDTESATDLRKVRPGFEALLSAAPEAVITWHEDRLIRTTRDLERVIALGVDVHVVKHGRLELSTPTGRAVARTVVAWAQFEQEHKAERQHTANLQRAEEGKAWKTALRTFGFEDDGVTPRAGEADRVREAFQSVLDGVPARALLRRWAAEGVVSTKGAQIGSRSLMDLLTRPSYAGRRVYRGVDRGPLRDADGEPVVPIVDPDVFAAVQVILADPARNSRAGIGPGPKHLLSGIAVCGHDGCGAPMHSGVGRGGVGGQRYLTLKCTRARHLERQAEPIERLVVEAVLARLRRADAAGIFVADKVDLAPLHARAASLRAQREALAADLSVDLEFAAARDKRLKEELVSVTEEIAGLSTSSVPGEFAAGDDPADVWERSDLDTRRAVLRALVDVVVLPTGRVGRRGFDPSSVVITFRA